MIRAFWTGMFASLASGAGLLISGIMPYTGGSALLMVICLFGAAVSATLAVGAGDPAVQARRRLAKEKKQREIRERTVLTLAEWDKKYGPSVVTPVQKPKALPVCTTPPVTGATSPVIGGSMTTDQFIRQVAKAAEESYVPEGSAELQANLLEALRDQAAEGVKGSHWEMNAEWAAEVKKLPKSPGYSSRNTRLWEPRHRVMPPGYPDVYLLGFPVRVSDEYGAPSLEAP